ALMLQGVGETQLSTVSYGEERPVATGTDEPSWQQNRRVELIYIG
ncbi:MAG: peptidoglycan-associated lipoprotein, partial [Steroidobacteraceae bacterium]